MWGSVFVGLACAITASDVTGTATAGNSDLTREEIVAALQERDRQLQALRLEYREISRGGSIESPVEGGYTRRVIAVRKPNWFLRDNGHGHAQMHWRDDPLRKTLLVTPEQWRVLAHLNRVLSEGPLENEVPEEVTRELLFRVLCWWPFEGTPAPQVFGRPWSMEQLMASGEYQLRDGVEFIDGRPCRVLEIPNVDVLWVDRERPACVLRRDVHNADTGAVSMRFEMSDYRSFGSGLWLPGAFRNMQFDAYAHTPELQQRCVMDSRFEVSGIAVNEDVREEDFHLALPPGTIRYRTDGDEAEIAAVTEGHAQHFESIVDWSRRLLAGNTGTQEQPHQYAALFGLPVGFAAAWLALAVVLPRRQRLSAESGSKRKSDAVRAPEEDGES